MACDRCNNTGHCPACRPFRHLGRGRVAWPEYDEDGEYTVTGVCTDCGGDGKCPKCHGYPHWTRIDCHCHGGEVQSGSSHHPVQCSTCKGAGEYWRHEPSGVLAMYPGGPFLGRAMY